MIKLTKDEIRRALQEYSSCEPDDFGNDIYYLWVKDDGKIVDGYMDADQGFQCTIDSRVNDDFPEDYDWREDVEVEGNKYFEEVVDDLYYQAKEYFENLL